MILIPYPFPAPYPPSLSLSSFLILILIHILLPFPFWKFYFVLVWTASGRFFFVCEIWLITYRYSADLRYRVCQRRGTGIYQTVNQFCSCCPECQCPDILDWAAGLCRRTVSHYAESAWPGPTRPGRVKHPTIELAEIARERWVVFFYVKKMCRLFKVMKKTPANGVISPYQNCAHLLLFLKKASRF